MAFPCPYCRHAIKIKSPKPGRYKPTCRKCRKQFRLMIDDQGTPQAEAVPDLVATRVGISKEDDDHFIVKTIPQLKPIKIKPPPEEKKPVPETLGGYQIIRELGRGGMGSVYLARQASLDRTVALKVMNPAWGNDAAFVARFMREAYAAAQLSHHHVVQIYDFGRDRGVHYFSMEYVEGQSLGQLVREQGKIEVEKAVGYILQAARGLKYAHDRGMVHRDIKPDNLLLNVHGIVKVADLGLVKAPDVTEEPSEAGGSKVLKSSKLGSESITDVTRAGVAMGTPAYMAPEQARNPSRVDGRADIYALGCTLYVLLTGRPPFQASTVLEIIDKHATEPIVPPDTIVREVPRALSEIILKMVAKKPEDRYADMGEVAHALEEWLGLKGDGTERALTEEQATHLEDCVRHYDAAPLANLRLPIRLAIVGVGCGLAVLALLFGWFKIGFALLSFTVESMLAAFVFAGLFGLSPLFSRVRQYIIELRWTTWLRIVLGMLLFLGVLVLFKLVWAWLLATAIAVAVGAMLYFALDRTVEENRRPILNEAEELLKQLRLRGMDEVELRHFVCKFGGNAWEEFYEALFGYEEKLKARDWWLRVQQGQQRPRYAAWREPLIEALDRRLQSRREDRERHLLRRVEEDGLIAAGANSIEARQKAAVAADRMVQAAHEIRLEEKSAYRLVPEVGPRRRPRPIAAVMLRPVETGPDDDVESPSLERRISAVLDVVMAPTVRMVLGLTLLMGCSAWMYQNGLIDQMQSIQSPQDVLDLLRAREAGTLKINTVSLPFFGFGAAIGGLLMVLAAFLPNWKASLVMPLAALVAWLGPWLGMPDVGPMTAAQLSMAIGGVLGVLGILLGREP